MSIQVALSPPKKALVAEELLKNYSSSNQKNIYIYKNKKTRIAPAYDDDKNKGCLCINRINPFKIYMTSIEIYEKSVMISESGSQANCDHVGSRMQSIDC